MQYNFLNEYLPQYDDLPRRLMRSAVIGFSASAISDTCSNSIRVIKTSKQTATTSITYPEVVKASHPAAPVHVHKLSGFPVATCWFWPAIVIFLLVCKQQDTGEVLRNVRLNQGQS